MPPAQLFQLCCVTASWGLGRFPFLHTQTTLLKPSECKSCLPRNTKARGPSLFSVQAAWKPLQLQPPPSPSSLNLPIGPALERGLAAGKQLHFEKVLPSPRNAKDDIMLNPGQTKEATSACPSHAAPCPCPLRMRGLAPKFPCICPVPAVGEAAHAASFPTLVPCKPLTRTANGLLS